VIIVFWEGGELSFFIFLTIFLEEYALYEHAGVASIFAVEFYSVNLSRFWVLELAH
jgi:hypothetical protein